jgi:putative transposase
MVQYRRNLIPGGTYFFTVTLRDRRAKTLVENINTLREALRCTLRQRPFVIDAMVVLPDHTHAVWTLPAGDADYVGRWRLLKSLFTQSLVRTGIGLSRNTRGEYDLWQRRYWEHTIRNAADLARHVDYIHINPVKHGLVEQVPDWPYSTFHRFVRQELYSLDWAGSNAGSDDGRYGE